jgi:hypothetical protein
MVDALPKKPEGFPKISLLYFFSLPKTLNPVY